MNIELNYISSNKPDENRLKLTLQFLNENPIVNFILFCTPAPKDKIRKYEKN